MCIRTGSEDWRGAEMDINNFKKLAPYFKDTESVVLSGWGEPLLYKHLFEAVTIVRERGAQAGFVTSGKGLNNEYISELIDAGIDFVGFSLAGATSKTHNYIRANSDFDVLVNDIRTFVEIKKNKGLNKPDLHIVYLMLKDNIPEIPSVINLARDIGINTAVFTNIIHVTNEWQESQRVFECNVRGQGNNHFNTQTPGSSNPFEEILKEAEAAARDLKINLRLPSLSPGKVNVCEENPLKNLYISVDGEVSPCVYLYPPVSSPFKRIFCGAESRIDKLSFGNIFKEPFHEIWNSKRYSEFRECFSKRDKNPDKRFPYFSDIKEMKKLSEEALPEPPDPCMKCHKILGL